MSATDMLTSRQFLSWMLLFTSAFVGTIWALEAIGVPTTFTFAAGILFSNMMDIAVDPLTESYVAEIKEESDR